jgi:glycogen synthase kinase 3 beta
VSDYYPETLSTVLNFFRVSQKKAQLPPLLSKLYMFQLLRALAYLHSPMSMIAHRDLKPQNLLIDPDNHRLCLCDFGSAKRIENPLKEKSVSYIATRYYRAPELIMLCENYGVEVDLWAAGCVLCEMLRGGRVMFDGKSNADQLAKIMMLLGSPSEA